MDQPFGSNHGAPTALAAPERNQYFYGKLLDVPHLQREQEYLNSKRWLMNLLLYGQGVVSGLGVALSAKPNRLVIQPGVAIDGWGREILVPAMSIPFDPRALTDDEGKPAGTQSGAASVTISLCYQECGIDPAPVLIANCDPAGNCASSSTREQYAVIVKAGTLVPAPVVCNFSNLFKPPLPDFHAALASRVSQAYIEPTGLGCIPLAEVDLPASGDIAANMIVNSVRPAVVSNSVLLELIYCLSQRVQELSQPGPSPSPTPTA